MCAGKLSEKKMFCILKITEEREEWDPELDPDPDPLVRGTDPHQNVTDRQHWNK